MNKKNAIQLSLVIWIIVGLAACLPAGPAPETASPQTSPSSTAGVSPTSDSIIQAATPIDLLTPTGLPSETAVPGAVTPVVPLQPVPGIELNAVDPAALNRVVQSGAYWIRRNSLKWSAVEPSEGERNWDAVAGLEAEFQASSKRGLELVLIVSGAPTWAQKSKGYPCGPVAAEKFSAFAQFLYDAVKRYSAAPYNVKYWELGNEPDVDPSFVQGDSPYGCWGDQEDVFYGGGYYAGMLQQVYPQIKAADPDAQVLVGGLLMDCDPVNPPEGKDCTPSLFMEGILRSGGGDFFDGISFHAYDYYSGPFEFGNANWNSNWDTTGPALIAKARYLRSLLAAYQHPEKFLLNSEAGVICGRSDHDPVCQTDEFELTKSYYLAQVNSAALVEGLRANIWYSLTGWRGTGLVDASGAPNKSFEALRFNAELLHDAAFIRTVTEISAVKGYEFLKGQRRIQVLWSADGEDHVTEFDPQPLAVFDVFGSSLKPAEELTITSQPVYIEWE